MSLLSPSFWFNLRPGSMPQIERNLIIGLLLTLIIAAIIFFILKKKKSFYKKILINLYDFCISNAFIGLLLLFFNYELVPFFSARFWFLIWAIVAIIWLVFVLKKLRKIPEKKKQAAEIDEIKKYLP